MRKPVLGVDIDGTLANTMDVFLKRVKMDYNITVSKSQITDYDMRKFLPLDNEQIKSTWAKAWENYDEIALEDKDAPEVLNRLKARFEIQVVTATNARHQNLEIWLKEKGIPYDKIWRFDRQVNKIDSGVDIHVDDCFEIVDLFVKGNKKMMLIEQPWNTKHHGSLKDQKLVNIVKGWKDIEGLLNKE